VRQKTHTGFFAVFSAVSNRLEFQSAILMTYLVVIFACNGMIVIQFACIILQLSEL